MLNESHQKKLTAIVWLDGVNSDAILCFKVLANSQGSCTGGTSDSLPIGNSSCQIDDSDENHFGGFHDHLD